MPSLVAPGFSTQNVAQFQWRRVCGTPNCSRPCPKRAGAPKLACIVPEQFYRGKHFMSRLLVLAAVITVVYLLLKSSYRGRAAGKEVPGPAEDMVRCRYCGVHVPRSESLISDGIPFCCEAHRRTFQPTSRRSDGG